MWQKVMNFYNTNAPFHSLVIALEYATVSFLTSYSGGLPKGKAGWVALVASLGGALWAAGKRWMATNEATKNLKMAAK
jgi:hypothetical protein